MRTLSALLTVIAVAVSACTNGEEHTHPYASTAATLGESLELLGWNMSVANLRFEAEHVLVDIDAAPSDPDGQHAAPQDLRFGLYGALAHPIEADGLGGCGDVTSLNIRPLSAPSPDRLTGTVCLGPIRDHSQVRGVYAYSPQDRMPGTTAAYPAAFPVGVLPTNESDTGLVLKTSSLDAFRADGSQLGPAALGNPEAFTGQGYMLLGLEIEAVAERYREDSARRGGPMMVVVAPTLPKPGLSHACDRYGSSLLVLPDAALDSVRLQGSLCTQGEISDALLYATVSVIGTHAGLWTVGDD